ncbi:MAG TPA: 50S ribosomal protein L5 [Candidatus Paceibacterota bacterium]
MENVKGKQQSVFKELKDLFSFSNPFQAPRLVKVIVSTGTGKISDKKKIALIEDRLMKITGQKAAPRGAKKSIASFKLREGDVIGYQTTLRGERMYDFLDRLIHIALPRTRDFRGLPVSAIDAMGNYTIGIKEHTIFPETSDEEHKDVFGLAVTIVTTARTKQEAETFLRHLGFPLQKIEA